MAASASRPSPLSVFPLACALAALGGVTSLVASGCSSSNDATAAVTPATPDADGGADGGGDPSTAPFTTTAGSWSWNPVDGMKCGNGEGTGVGVNLGTSDRVVVYFEGGGACWNGLTCFSAQTATGITEGFGESQFNEQVVNGKLAGSIFDRQTGTNVFKDATYVYIPYCTGDVHGGAKVTTYDPNPPVYHVGRTNAELAIKRIAANFKGKTSRLVVSGSSAGGFGAAINYERFATAFAPTRVDLIDDSGPPIPAAKTTYLDQWNASWDLFGSFPKDCAACATDPAFIMPYYAAKYPGSRFALLSYDHDNVISKFYGLSQDEFKVVIEDVASTQFAKLTNGRYFYVAGTSHTMLRTLSTASGGTTLGAFLTSMVGDAADWKNVPVGN
jgi:hypothetical protein